MKDSKISQFVILLVMVVTGNLSLSDDQIEAITQVIMSGGSPNVAPSMPNTPATAETIRGMTELAQILGVSVPTACKISRSGKFDEARLNFGTKKHVWDRAKLLDLARKK